MEGADIVKLVEGGGFAAALLLILYRVLTTQAEGWSKRQSEAMERLVGAVDRIGVKVEINTESIIRLEGKIDGAADERERTGLTPIRGVPTRARSEPGVYGLGKKP